MAFTVLPQRKPTISDFTPDHGLIGTTIVLTGTNFQNTSAVKFNQTPAEFTIDSQTQITAEVPVGASSGPIAVTTVAGTTTLTSFTVDFTPADDSIVDIKIGDRTADPTLVPTANSGSLTQWISWFTNRIRAITGADTWTANPAITLAQTRTELDLKEPLLDNPDIDGQILSSTVIGERSWIDPPTTDSRQIRSFTTAALASNATENLAVGLAQTFILQRIQTSSPAWVRLYTTPGYRTADANRLRSVDPVGEHGLIADVLTIPTNLSLDLAPLVLGASLSDPPSDEIAIAVTNTGTNPTAIQTTLTYLALENPADVPPPPPGVFLTFEFLGDTKGVLYYLGTNKGVQAWQNPHTSGQVTVTMSSNNQYAVSLVNRQGGASTYTTNAIGSYIAMDLGVNRTLVPAYYTLQHDNENGYYQRNWLLQGSNNVAGNTVDQLNAATWTTLSVHTNDATLNAPEAWGGWPLVTANAYRWFRITNTGPDSSGTNYLVLGEIEFYGQYLEV